MARHTSARRHRPGSRQTPPGGAVRNNLAAPIWFDDFNYVGPTINVGTRWTYPFGGNGSGNQWPIENEQLESEPIGGCDSAINLAPFNTPLKGNLAINIYATYYHPGAGYTPLALFYGDTEGSGGLQLLIYPSVQGPGENVSVQWGGMDGVDPGTHGHFAYEVENKWTLQIVNTDVQCGINGTLYGTVTAGQTSTFVDHVLALTGYDSNNHAGAQPSWYIRRIEFLPAPIALG